MSEGGRRSRRRIDTARHVQVSTDFRRILKVSKMLVAGAVEVDTARRDAPA